MIRDPIETFGQYWVWGVAVIFMAIWVIKYPREIFNIIIFLAQKSTSTISLDVNSSALSVD